MARLIRGLSSLAVLVLGTLGVPVALAFLGGNPLPEELTWNAVQRALFTPVDGMILVGLITIVGWLAWLVFMLSVISEPRCDRLEQRVRSASLASMRRSVCSRIVDLCDHDDLGAVRRASRSSPRPPCCSRTLPAPEPAELIVEPAHAAALPRSGGASDGTGR